MFPLSGMGLVKGRWREPQGEGQAAMGGPEIGLVDNCEIPEKSCRSPQGIESVGKS